MKALVMNGPRKSVLVDVPDLEPAAGEVLIKVKYTGLCMSDWHPWDEAKGGERMGHEPLGTIVALGTGVTGFAVGDRVTGLSITPTYAEYCLCRADCLVHVPANLSDEDAVVEPLSCLVSVASKLRTEKAGDTVAVVGAGYMGLGVLTLLKLQGAGRIISVDPRIEARENALRFGADEVYSPEDVPAKYLITEWDDTMWQRGVGLVCEFAGTESALRLAGDMTALHGTLGAGGWHQGGMRTVDFRLWGWKAITVINTHERRTAFPGGVLQERLGPVVFGQVELQGVSNHIYALDEFDRANHDMESKPKGFIKALVRCSDW